MGNLPDPNPHLSIKDCIQAITKLEQEKSTSMSSWTTSQLLDSLRDIAGYNGSFFREVLGTKDEVQKTLDAELMTVRYNDLRKTLIHDKTGYRNNGSWNETNGLELGTSPDMIMFPIKSGEKVARPREICLGHVICGISAGIHHTKPQNISAFLGMTTSVSKNETIANPSRTLDPLYTLTISGDIGQTISCHNYLSIDKEWKYGGIGNEASSAELHGDIDGFMLGAWLCASKKGLLIRDKMRMYNWNDSRGIKLSTMLGEYYGTLGSRSLEMHTQDWLKNSNNLNSAYRFVNFKETLVLIRDGLYNQVTNFQDKYSFALCNGLRETWCSKEDNKKRIDKAFLNFEKWCTSNGTIDFHPPKRAGNKEGIGEDGFDPNYDPNYDPDNYDFFTQDNVGAPTDITNNNDSFC